MAVFRDGNRPKDRLPLEHMSLDDDLRFFLEIFYNMEIVNYDCEGFYAGVMLDNQRKLKMGVNLDLLDQFQIPEELYILTHEGGHIVFDHLIRGERMVNKKAANIAADAVLNSIINRHYPQLKMPKKDGKTLGITLESLYKDGLIKDADLNLLKKDLKELTTDDVYEIIMKNAAEKEGGQGQQGHNCPNCGNDMAKPPKSGKQQGKQGQQGQQQGQQGQQGNQAGQQGQQGGQQGNQQGQQGQGQPGQGQPGQGGQPGQSGQGGQQGSQGQGADGEGEGEGDGQGNGKLGKGPGGQGSGQNSEAGDQMGTPSQGQGSTGSGSPSNSQGNGGKSGGSGNAGSQSNNGGQLDSTGPGTPTGKGTKIHKGNTMTCPHCGEEVEVDEDGNGQGTPGQGILNQYDKQRLDNHEGVTGDDVDDETKQQIEELIRQAKSGMYGDKAGNFVRDLMDAVKKHFPFKEILDKIIYKEKYDFAREHRRVKIPNGYLPRRRSEKIKVYAMLDVSGSCYDYTEDFVGYIMALDEFEEIILIDTQIQMVVKKGDGIPKVVPGGGGTDLNPGFEHWREVEQTTKGYKLNFICLTDGEIPELQTGPVQSKVVVLTTHEEVHYKNSPRRYLNIKITPDED